MIAHEQAAARIPRLALAGVTKRYGDTLANDRIDLAIMPGEIHALLGENGAGKSTLVKIIDGIVHPDAGTLAWEGRPVRIADPAGARRLGIGTVFQHFTLFETLTVAENAALALERPEGLRGLAERIDAISRQYGLQLDPRRHVHALSVGERQRVEIVRCLLQKPRLLIMDEPTSVLTPQEVGRLFVVLRRLREEGCAILFISHKLDEVRELCDGATVLRMGRVVATCDPRRESAASLAEMMVGRGLAPVNRPPPHAGQVVLEIIGLTLPRDDPFGIDLSDIHLALRAGEIVGIAGVAGNGQTELLRALSGERQAAAAAAIKLSGEPIGALGPWARRARGLGFVPEERLGRGAVAEMSLAENALLTGYGAGLAARGIVLPRRVRELTRRIRAGFGVVASGDDARAASLSGGNLQKFIIGREILLAPRVLIAAHPTWGVDVGAARAIHQALLDLRDRGAAVLLVSEDLDELLAIADRIAVLSRGRLTPTRALAETSREEIGIWMSGLNDRPEPADAA